MYKVVITFNAPNDVAAYSIFAELTDTTDDVFHEFPAMSDVSMSLDRGEHMHDRTNENAMSDAYDSAFGQWSL